MFLATWEIYPQHFSFHYAIQYVLPLFIHHMWTINDSCLYWFYLKRCHKCNKDFESLTYTKPPITFFFSNLFLLIMPIMQFLFFYPSSQRKKFSGFCFRNSLILWNFSGFSHSPLVCVTLPPGDCPNIINFNKETLFPCCIDFASQPQLGS